MSTADPAKGKSNNIIDLDPVQIAPDSGALIPSEDREIPVRNALSGSPKGGKWILFAGSILAMLWSAGALAYVAGMLGVNGLLSQSPAQFTGLAFGVAGPAILIFALGWAVREMFVFAGYARKIQSLADRFADPAKITREDATLMASQVSEQIERINISVEGALARFGAMEEVLLHHTEAFDKADISARERTDTLINDLRREREAVEELAVHLDQKTADIAQAISDQSKMVVAAADIANAQTQEGAKAISLSVDQLQEASRNTEGTSRALSDHLETSTRLIEKSAKELGLAKTDLDASANALQSSNDTAVGKFEQSRMDIQELVAFSNTSAAELQAAAEDSAKAMKQSMGEALDQARQYTSILREETISLGERHSAKSAELKKAAEEAKTALDDYADSISKRLEHANEASFSAASWADKTFEKLQESTQALDEHLSKLPEAADNSARELDNKLRQGISGMNAAAKSAAEEAQSIDAAFQSRIRHNYDMLSELMLKIGATAAPMGAEVEVPNPLARRLMAEEETSKPVQTSAFSNTVEDADDFSNTDVRNVQDDTPLPPVPEIRRSATKDDKPEGWRWKDVLSRIDKSGQPPASEPEGLDRLAQTLRKLNIQPDQLFDATSYRAAALTRLTDGRKAMAQVATNTAGSAVEKLRVAFEEDPSIRLDAELFTAELRDKVDQAARTGQQMHVETHLRTGDGPAFLLLEAALQ